MARARNIKPGFYTNEDLAECSVWARYIFPGLWMMADREGRLEYRPKKIKGELLRFDEQAAEPLLEELKRWGFIEIYEVEGRAYIQILTFHKHQNPHHREVESDIPPPQSPGLTPLGIDSKPGATNGLDDGQAQGKPEASPGIELEEATCQGGQAGLIPDSGFSDSLIPDSGSPSEALVVVHTNAPEEKPAPLVPNSRAAQISLLMRSNGVEGCNPSNPIVIEWAADGRVTDETLLTAAAMAKKREVLRPGPNYLAPIVQQLLNPKPPRQSDSAWKRSPAGIEGKASELGIVCPPGRDHAWLLEKCESEMRKRAQGVAA